MRVLLDTHLLLWWLAASPSLPEQARALIGASENTVFVSAVSLWEIWLKESLGKLRLPADFEERLAEGDFESMPLTGKQARLVACCPGTTATPSTGCWSPRHKRRTSFSRPPMRLSPRTAISCSSSVDPVCYPHLWAEKSRPFPA